MAMAINYCDQCGVKIAASEFSSGTPVHHGEQTFCQKCALKAGIEIPPEPVAPPKKTPHQNRVIERPQRHTDHIHTPGQPHGPTRKKTIRNTQRMVLLLILACVSGLGITIYLLNIKIENATTMSRVSNRTTAVKVNPEVRKNLRENAQEGMLEVKALGAWDKADGLFQSQQWETALAEYQAFKTEFANTSFLAKQTLALNRRIAAINAVLKPVFELPKEWKGGASKSTDGNPRLIDQVARWRLDRLWPDDPLKLENYKTMVWNGKHWQGEDNLHSEQPEAWIADGNVVLNARSAWSDNPGNKLPVLVFIAPLKANYSLSVAVRPEIFEGGAPLQIHLIKRTVREGKIENLATIELKNKESFKIDQQPVALDEHEELVLIPSFGTGNCAAKFALSALKILCKVENNAK
jgi:hypothetical protein